MDVEFMMSRLVSTPTPLWGYSPTHFSKKLVFPWRDGGHPRKRVGHTLNVRMFEGNHKVLYTELDVMTHETRYDRG
jgi:hypothetical protein